MFLIPIHSGAARPIGSLFSGLKKKIIFKPIFQYFKPGKSFLSTVKETIIRNLCYTDLVYSRINRKLNLNFSREQIEHYILKILRETDDNSFSKTGKNFYVSNVENDIRITINSNTFRVITVDEISLL